jgi:hypothetical protein
MSEMENAQGENPPTENGPTENAPETETSESTTESAAEQTPAEEITYHAVEKDGQVTAIWEMQGRKHLRTIDPRSRQGQEILRLYTADHHDEQPAQESGDTASA